MRDVVHLYWLVYFEKRQSTQKFCSVLDRSVRNLRNFKVDSDQHFRTRSLGNENFSPIPLPFVIILSEK